MRALVPIDPDRNPAKALREIEAEWFREDPAGAGDADGYNALCLSGGGIRSATFCLGVLQGLARWPRNENGTGKALETFHYLSTVSGGGYIGTWLSRWIHEEPGGLKSVVAKLASDDEPTTIKQLRAYSSYLAPKRGLSTDAFTLLGITGRNLVLNWTVLIPAVVLLLLLPRLAVTAVLFAGDPDIGSIGTLTEVVAFGLAALLAIDVVAHVTKNLPPSPQGGDSAVRFTLVLPLAALAWSIGWAAAAPRDLHGSPSEHVVAVFRGFGALLTPPTVLWNELRSPSRHPIFWRCVMAGIAIPILGALEGIRRRSPAVQAAAGWPGILTWLETVLAGACAGFFLFLECKLLVPVLDVRAYVTMAMPCMLAVYWLGTVAYVGLTSASRSGPQGAEGGESGREWWARAGAASLRPVVSWMVLSLLVLFAPSLLLWTGSRFLTGASIVGVVSAAASALAGFFGRGGVDDRGETSTWRERLAQRILPISATLALVLGAILISLMTSRALYIKTVDDPIIADGPKREQTNREEAAVRTYVDDIHIIERYPKTVGDVGQDLETNELAKRSVEDVRAEAARAKAKQGLEKFIGVAHSKREETVLWWSAMHGVVTSSSAKRWGVVVALIVLLVVIVLASMTVGVNRFSLHSMYANRLIRAFLGAARETRTPNRFNGFDPDDDLAMAELLKRPGKSRRLFHVVNIALNRGEAQTAEELATQKRMATSFTVSPLYAGSVPTGYQPSANYAGGISQGRAMAISGAAVSPAMGYHSSAPVAALMTLANVRLGWWLPNPGPVGSKIWSRSEPTFGVRPLLEELAGHSGSRSKWVYLSDGGHLDNLGLYEMARRRCRRIVLVDASQDGESAYDDLSRSLRMIRADFGVSVKFEGAHRPIPGVRPAAHFMVGTIEYPDRDGEKAVDGILIYIKPFLGTDAPVDVVAYAAQRRAAGINFPHESTGDQFFDEMQFESYRRLGLLSVEALIEAFDTLADVKVIKAEESPHDTGAPPAANGSPGDPPSRNGEGSWLGSIGTILVPAAVSTAIAMTLVVAVTGTVQIEPPKTPLPVTAPTPLPVAASGPFKLVMAEGPSPPVPPGGGSSPKPPPDVGDGTLSALLEAQKEALAGIKAGVDRIPWAAAEREKLIAKMDAQVKALDGIRDVIQARTPPDAPTPASLAGVVDVLRKQLVMLKQIRDGVDSIPTRRNIRGVRGDD